MTAPAPPPAQTEADVMTPAQVAVRFNVHSRTVSRWAANGRLRSFRTPAGHRRYYRDDVERLIAETTSTPDPDPVPVP